MRRRADNVSRLERELETMRNTIAELETESARQAELAAEADAEARAAAGDPAAFAEAGRRADAHRSERTRLEYLVEDRTKQLVELERQLAYAEHEQAGMTLAGRQKRRRDASTKVGGILEQLATALGELAKARDAVAESELEFRARVPSDVDEWEFPLESRDESDWPELGDLLEVVEAGPRRPLANQAAGIEQARLMGEQRIRTHASQAAREALVHGDYGRLRRLTPEERAAAVPAAEQLVGTFDTERERTIAARRLERIREVVAEAEVAA